jgi:chorismate mutase
VSDQSQDPAVQQLREQISDNDLAILDAVNKRLALVHKLWVYKRGKGYDVVDPSREDWMLAYVARCNRGPLSNDAARELFSTLLELTKRESARLHEESAATSA